MQELRNVFGDLIETKDLSAEFPYKIGEEAVLLSLSNTCSYVTRSYTPVITLDALKYFRAMSEIGPRTLKEMRLRCSLKLHNLSQVIRAKLRGEVLKDEMGCFKKD